MKLLVGLGNPGKQYEHNRHNVGFIFIDFVLQKLNNTLSPNKLEQSWKFDKLFESELARSQFLNSEYILSKPQTFMNNSGSSVGKLVKAQNILSSDVLVAHDDLDIPFGKFKIQLANGPKIHNGINSIEQHLHSADFWRIRIGVDNRGEQRIPGEDYVLQDFTAEEQSQLSDIFQKIINRLPVI